MPPFRGFCRHFLLPVGPGTHGRAASRAFVWVGGLLRAPSQALFHTHLWFSPPQVFFLDLALGAPLDCLTLILNMACRELFREYPRTIREPVEMRPVPSIPPTPRMSWFFIGFRGRCCPFFSGVFFRETLVWFASAPGLGARVQTGCPKYGPPARADTQILLWVVGNDRRRRPQTWSVSAHLGVKILSVEADSQTRSSGEPYLGSADFFWRLSLPFWVFFFQSSIRLSFFGQRFLVKNSGSGVGGCVWQFFP